MVDSTSACGRLFGMKSMSRGLPIHSGRELAARTDYGIVNRMIHLAMRDRI
jgi:hypothetical protein